MFVSRAAELQYNVDEGDEDYFCTLIKFSKDDKILNEIKKICRTRKVILEMRRRRLNIRLILGQNCVLGAIRLDTKQLIIDLS